MAKDKEMHQIKWGAPDKSPEPTKGEIKSVLKAIRKKAIDKRAVSISITGPIYRYLKDHLENGYVHLITSGDGISNGPNDHWCIIGVDENAVDAYLRNSKIGVYQ